MKKLLLSAIMLLSLAFAAHAQDIPKNAIGLRLGSNDGFGAEVSYQRAIFEHNRLEFDLGWRDSNRYDAVKLIGLYQWVWKIDGGLNWYAGPGAGIGSYSYDNDNFPGNGNDDDYDDSGTFLVATGTIGIEYVFDIPLQVSLDFRPEAYFGDDFRDDNFGADIGLSARFTF